MPGRKETTRSAAIPAKISSPRLAETYRRARLFRVLDVARRQRAVWIAAPAGAGKTTVVTTYLHARRLPALWYNVDARDADVANLFHFLTAAARVAAPRRKLKIPAFKTENQAGVAAFTRGFFEALSRERPIPSVFVLDDYHEANSEGWDHVIREGICALPKHQCALIISRAEPPAAFARLLASREIAMIGPEDLRFTQREMTGLVHLYRPDLRGQGSKERIERACELANGWAAALTLLLQERDIGIFSPAGFEQRSQRLFEYFATEILDKLTPLQRDFLLKTSIAPSFDAALAVHISGIADAAQILVNFERRGFLTQRLGSSGAYRYHPLLREFLLRQAEREMGSAALDELHRRAAERLVEVGLIDEAMAQLEAARDVSTRARLVVDVAPSYVATGRSQTIAMWIDRLPRERVERDGWLSYWAAICCVGHSPSRARELLERAYAHFSHGEDVAGMYQCCAAAIQAVVHEGMDFRRLDPWAERLDRMLVAGPPCPDAFRPMAATGMLIASTFRPRGPSQGRYWAEQALQLTRESNELGHRVMTGGLLAYYFALHGDAAQASIILEMLRVTARAAKLSPLSLLALLQADVVCCWVRGDNATCLSLVREALAVAQRSGISVWNIFLHTNGVSSTLGLDDPAAAQEFLVSLAEAAQAGAPFLVGGYHFNKSWELLARGDAARALHSAELARHSADLVGYPLAQCNARLAVAQALFQLRRTPEAVEALREARRHAEDIESSYLLYGCDLMEADFVWDSDRPRALERLRGGLKLGRERNYHNMFCLSRRLMTRTAERALEHDIEPSYVRDSIAIHRLKPEKIEVCADGWPWRYRVCAIGAFTIECDDRSMSRRGSADGSRGGPRGMPLRLLRAIVALGGREVSEVSLIDALWPDADGDAGRRVFDTTLHRLRRQLGDDHVLRLTAGRVGLDERLCWVDTWAAEHVFAESARQIEARAPGPVLLALSRRLLQLCRGPLLVDETAVWVRAPRERFAKKLEHTATRLGRSLEALGEFAQAALLYQRMVEGDPLAEGAYAGLLRCALGEGRHAAAARLFAQYRAKLATEHNAVPSRELLEIGSQLEAETRALGR